MDILNIELEEKTDFTLRLTFRDDTTNLPVDITGYTAILEIRPQFGDYILLSSLDTTDDHIELGGQSGTIDIIFSAAQTDLSAQTYGWTRGAYDLVLIDTAGSRKKLLKGFVTIARSATLDSPA